MFVIEQHAYCRAYATVRRYNDIIAKKYRISEYAVVAMLTVREFCFCKNSSVHFEPAPDYGKFIVLDYASALA